MVSGPARQQQKKEAAVASHQTSSTTSTMTTPMLPPPCRWVAYWFRPPVLLQSLCLTTYRCNCPHRQHQHQHQLSRKELLPWPQLPLVKVRFDPRSHSHYRVGGPLSLPFLYHSPLLASASFHHHHHRRHQPHARSLEAAADLPGLRHSPQQQLRVGRHYLLFCLPPPLSPGLRWGLLRPEPAVARQERQPMAVASPAGCFLFF